VQQIEDSLTILQLKNDSLAFDFVLDKFENSPGYFKENFNSVLNAFFLHSIKKLHNVKHILNYILVNDPESVSGYSIYIDRYYCTKYNRSAFDSKHCKKDTLLQNLMKVEFPVFYKAYLTTK